MRFHFDFCFVLHVAASDISSVIVDHDLYNKSVTNFKMSNIEKWKILSKEDVSPSKWFPIERHSVALPNGKILDDYYVTTLGEVVVIVAITVNHELVLVQQYKHGLGEVIIELPAGMKQENTSLIQSAANELEEETGIKVDPSAFIYLGKLCNNPTKSNQVSHGYLITDVTFNSQQQLDDTEEISVLTYPVSVVPDIVKDGRIWSTDSACFILLAVLEYPEIFKHG
ncbi:MAG: NUDIX hydrolase [Agriterribacter sp.]